MGLLLAAIFLQGYAEPEIAFGTWARVKRAGITLGCIQGWWNERYFKENIPLWAPSVFAFLVLLFPTFLGMVTGMTAMQRVSKVKIIAFFWVLSFVLTYFLVDTDPEKLTWGKASPFMYIPQFLMGMFTGELFNTRPDYDVKPMEILMSRFGGAGGLFVIFICMLFIPTFEPMGREGESFSQIETVMNHWNYFGMLAPLYCFTLYWLGNGGCGTLGLVVLCSRHGVRKEVRGSGHWYYRLHLPGDDDHHCNFCLLYCGGSLLQVDFGIPPNRKLWEDLRLLNSCRRRN